MCHCPRKNGWTYQTFILDGKYRVLDGRALCTLTPPGKCRVCIRQLEYLAVYGRASMCECAPRKCGPKFIEIFRRMLLHKTPNHAKFCGDRLKNAGDIRDRKFVLPEKVGPSSPKFFRGRYPQRPPIVPNFIEIGQTSLEKSVKKRYLFGPSRCFLSRTETWLLESRLAACERRNLKQDGPK